MRWVRMMAGVISGAMLAGAAAAADYEPSFRPDRLKGPAEGPRNEVMVLGTIHLSDLPDSFDPALLQPLLARLAAWKPQAIATEDMSGLQCDMLRRYPARYTKDTLDYCYDTTPAERATGLDVPAANAEAERLLAGWPQQPTPAQRRRLAAVFLAAGERGSALVQWLRLAPAERRVGDGLNTELVAYLEGRRTRRNETYLIAAPLAARLGLERLWNVDDHSADSPTPPDQQKAFEQAVMRIWDNPFAKERRTFEEQIRARLTTAEGVLDLYRAYNGPRAQMLAFQSDFGAAMNDPSPQRFGRRYLGYWETRNLRMVANMRDVLAQRPGTRMLTIVGASHKGYYEAYLHQMHDVRVVDTAQVLR